MGFWVGRKQHFESVGIIGFSGVRKGTGKGNFRAHGKMESKDGKRNKGEVSVGTETLVLTLWVRHCVAGERAKKGRQETLFILNILFSYDFH